MRRLILWGVTVAAVAMLVGTYQLGLRAAAQPARKPRPTLLLLCVGTDIDGGGDIDRFAGCSSTPLVLKTLSDCNQALASGTWVIAAAQRLHAANEALSLLCMPPEAIARHRPSAAPKGKPITG
jgi:hypothetical protein